MPDAARVRRLWSRAFSLGWPIATEQVFRTLMRTTDTIITAQLSPAAVVAVGLADLYNLFPLRIGLGFGGGAISLSSQDTGAGDVAGRNQSISQALVMGVLVGVPVALIGLAFNEPMIAVLGAEAEVVRVGSTYLGIVLATAPARHVSLVGTRALQGTGDTRTPMVLNILGNVVNIVISVLLGLGLFGAPQLGVVGVGVGTATANVLVAVLMLAVIAGPWSEIALVRPRDITVTRQLLAVGVPQMGEGFVVALTRFPFNVLLLGFGTEVNAGYHIGRRILQQVTAPLRRSTKTAASIIVGQEVGRNEMAAARFAGWWVTAFGALTVGLIGLGVFLAAGPLVGVIVDDPLTAGFGAAFTMTYGITVGPYVVFAGLSGALRGAGETRAPFYARLVGVVVFTLGFTYVVGELLGHGATAAYVGIALSFLTMTGLVLWSYARGGWEGRAASMLAERRAGGEA